LLVVGNQFRHGEWRTNFPVNGTAQEFASLLGIGLGAVLLDCAHNYLTVGLSFSIPKDPDCRACRNHELYFEMKTPQPNKGQCIGMKRFILQVAALRAGHSAEAFASSAYNPYGDGKPYTWNYAEQFLQIGQDMLLG